MEMKITKTRPEFFLAGLLWIAFSAPIWAQGNPEHTQSQIANEKTAAHPVQAQHASKRDILLGFAQCLTGQSASMLAKPQSPQHLCGVTVFDDGKDGSAGLGETGNSPESVVIEDSKMSKCPVNAGADESNPRSFSYVHALAIPLHKVTGIEQEENRPSGIWDLAWRTATAYIVDTSEIALVANPKAENQYRSQDQLHIHLVRLLPDAKAEILHPQGIYRVPPVYIDRLEGTSGTNQPAGATDPVWAAAELNAAEFANRFGLPSGLKSGIYGVAVVYDESKGKYAVAVVDGSPERKFTLQCPGSAWRP